MLTLNEVDLSLLTIFCALYRIFGRPKGPQIIKVVLAMFMVYHYQATLLYNIINDANIFRPILKFYPLSYHQVTK